MTIHRLYTEDTNRTGIIQLLTKRFEGFTVIPTIGAWHGELEQSLVVELFGATRKQANEAADAIAQLNDQEAVAVASFDEDVQFRMNPQHNNVHLMGV